MPDWGDYQASVQPEGLPGRPYPRLPESVTPEEMGAGIGRGLEVAGDVVGEAERRAHEQAITTQVTDAHNQLQQLALHLVHDPQTGALTRQGKDAINLPGQYLPQYDEAAQKITAAVPPGIARTHALAAAAQMRNEMLSQLDTHELEQHRQLATGTAKASISLAQQAAAKNYNHPDILANNLETMDISIENLAKTQGWSPEELQEAQHTAHVQFHQGVLDNMLADKKTQLARAYLDVNRGELKPQEVQEARQKIEGAEVKGVTDKIAAAYATDTSAGAQQLTNLPRSGLTPEQQGEVVRQVEQRRAELKVVRRQDPQVAGQLVALQDHIADGTAGAADLAHADALWRRGALSDDDRFSMHRQISRVQAQATSDAQLMQPAQDAYTRGVPMDPSNADNRKGMDLLFQRSSKGMQPGSAEYTNLAVDMAHRTSINAATAVSWGRANLSNLQNADPKTASQAADLITRLAVEDQRGIDRQTKATAGIISEAVHAGTDPAQALRMAQTAAALPEAQRKLLDERWGVVNNPQSAQKNGIVPQPDALSHALRGDPQFTAAGWWARQKPPAAPLPMQADYDALTQDYFRHTNGDLNQARSLALQDLKHTWGYSEVNGKPELMKYAPEQKYPGLTAKMIHADLEAQGHKGAHLVFVPGITDSTNGQVWRLVMPDAAGNLNPVLDDKHQPQGYSLPLDKLGAKADEQKQQKVESDVAGRDAIEAAAEKRDQQRQLDEMRERRSYSGEE